MGSGKRQHLVLLFGEQREFPIHRHSRKVHCLQLKSAPIDWSAGRMYDHAINPADKVATVFIWLRWLGSHPVEKADLIQYKRVRSLKNRLADPAKDQIILKKPVGTSRDEWTRSRNWALPNLFVETKRTDAALLIAFGIVLKWAWLAGECAGFDFSFCALKPVARGKSLESKPVPFTNGIAAASLWLSLARHILLMAPDLAGVKV